MIKNLIPLGDRVVIKYNKATESTTKGGIILPDTASRGTAVFGEVVLVGNGIYSITGVPIPMTVRVGDTVMFKKDMVSDPITIDGVDYLLFREQDLLMAVQPELKQKASVPNVPSPPDGRIIKEGGIPTPPKT